MFIACVIEQSFDNDTAQEVQEQQPHVTNHPLLLSIDLDDHAWLITLLRGFHTHIVPSSHHLLLISDQMIHELLHSLFVAAMVIMVEKVLSSYRFM